MSVVGGGVPLSLVIHILSICAMICAWLIAGTFFAFSDFVMAGLARMEPEAAILAMQAMNVTVEERFFSVVANLLIPLSIVLVMVWLFLNGPRLLALGGVIFILGAAGPTVVGNIPPNDALASMSAQDPAAQAFWGTLVPDWLFYNHIRLAACVAAAICFSIATFNPSEKGSAQ